MIEATLDKSEKNQGLYEFLAESVKPFGITDMNLINQNYDFTKVKGEIKDDKLIKSLEVFVSKDDKKVRCSTKIKNIFSNR